MEKLSEKERLHLMKFVCSFVWADLEVKDSERKFVARMAERLGLTSNEIAMVNGWLRVPPKPEEVDPTTIPSAHRKMFLDAIREVVNADGEVQAEEAESLRLFEQLLKRRKD